MVHFWRELLHYIGADTSQSTWYYFWSAFGSGPLAWCAIPLLYYVHHICHEHNCVRIGHPNQHGEVHCRRHIVK